MNAAAMNAAAAFMKDVNGGSERSTVQQTFGFGIAELASEGGKPFRAAELWLLNAWIAGSRFAQTAEQSVAEIHSVGRASTTTECTAKLQRSRVPSRSHRNAPLTQSPCDTREGVSSVDVFREHGAHQSLVCFGTDNTVGRQLRLGLESNDP
jgi:hypothetical protein